MVSIQKNIICERPPRGSFTKGGVARRKGAQKNQTGGEEIYQNGYEIHKRRQ